MSTVSDPIADLLSRIRNAKNARLTEITLPHSRLKADMVRILKQEGYIANYEILAAEHPPQIKIQLKYVNRTSAITDLKRVSKPGLRKYVGAGDIPRVLGGLGIAILSTSRGVLCDREARKQHVGGELLAYVW
jgi:small subunit ribosomal protein S8